MLRFSAGALLVSLALAAPASAAPGLASVFEGAIRASHAIEVSPAGPSEWFPVRGEVDFGQGDARFGAWRGDRRHEGQDVFAEAGTPLVAMRAGRVVETGDDGGRGNFVAIWSRRAGQTFVYLHMRAPTPLREGEVIDAGRRVGAVGCTGSCWGDHLHLEIRRGRGTTGKPIDPMPALRMLSARGG